jgi:hypothetical protein
MIDLGLVNYLDHPSDENYKLFRFIDKKKADLFEKGLIEQNLKHQSHLDSSSGKTIYLFAVFKSDFKAAQKINFLISAQFRKPMITSKTGKWALLIIVGLVIITGFVGFAISKANGYIPPIRIHQDSIQKVEHIKDSLEKELEYQQEQ